MKQYIVLQEGFNAVRDYLDSLEQSQDSKYRYQRAFNDISAYYENRELLSYSPVFNAEYRNDLMSRYESGNISIRSWQQRQAMAEPKDQPKISVAASGCSS